MKAIKRSYNKNLSYLPLTGGTLSGHVSIENWLSILTDGWESLEFKTYDGATQRGGMQMGDDNYLVLFQKHADSDYCEKYSLGTPASDITAEMWYKMYSTKNITANTSALTAGTSALADGCIHLTYS